MPLVALVAATWYALKVHGYKTKLKARFADRNQKLADLGVSHWEDWDRVLANIAELASAGLGDEDIRRDLLLGDKYPRAVAVAVLDFASTPWPSLGGILSFREKALYAEIEAAANKELAAIGEGAVSDAT